MCQNMWMENFKTTPLKKKHRRRRREHEQIKRATGKRSGNDFGELNSKKKAKVWQHDEN